MRWLTRLRLRIQSIVKRSKLEHDLDQEIRFHLAEQKAELVSQGMTDEEAEMEARRSFGSAAASAEECRDQRRTRWLDDLVGDAHFALRMLRRSPGFAGAAVAILALGIGANSAMFSLFDAVLLRLLPVRDPQQLYLVHMAGADEGVEAISFPMFLQFRDALQGAAEILTQTRPAPFYASIQGAAGEPVTGQLVSGEFFSVLGVRPALGRLFTADDNLSLGQHPVLVISHAYWQRRFGGSPGVLGNSLRLNGAPFTIVGVAEHGFFGASVGESPEVWLPLLMQAEARYAENVYSSNADTRKPWPPQEGLRWLDAVIRVQDPGSVKAVEATINVLYRRDQEREGQFRNERERRLLLERRLVLAQGGQGFSVFRRRFSKPLTVLTMMVGLSLLTACANIAGLLVGRSMVRQREIAIRLSIGASRLRLMRQFLTESIVLAAIGGMAGFVIAAWSTQMLPRVLSIDVHLQLDYRLLAYTAGVSVLTGILFGLAPALRMTHLELATSLKASGGPLAQGQRLSLGRALVVVQVAFSLLLVTGTGLLARTLWNLVQTELGVDTVLVLTVRIDPRAGGFEAAQLPALYTELAERVGALPGVHSASIARSSIAGGGIVSSGINVPGYAPGPRENMHVDENFVDAGYFATVGMKLVEGRGLESRDTEKALKVAVINETMARRYFGSQSPIGRSYGYGGVQFQIVGVVRDAKLRGPRAAVRPIAYRPIRQEVDYARSLEVRTQADPRAVAAEVRKALVEVAPNLPIQDVATISERVNRLVAQERLIAEVAALFGLLALLLACIGLYGLTSYGVARRTAEMGIRMALGATRASLVWLVLREALALVAIGFAVGIPLLFAAGRLVAGLLFGVSPTDPPTVAATALLMLCIATLAAYLPARRASRVDPTVALRQE